MEKEQLIEERQLLIDLLSDANKKLEDGIGSSSIYATFLSVELFKYNEKIIEAYKDRHDIFYRRCNKFENFMKLRKYYKSVLDPTKPYTDRMLELNNEIVDLLIELEGKLSLEKTHTSIASQSKQEIFTGYIKRTERHMEVDSDLKFTVVAIRSQDARFMIKKFISYWENKGVACRTTRNPGSSSYHIEMMW